MPRQIIGDKATAIAEFQNAFELPQIFGGRLVRKAVVRMSCGLGFIHRVFGAHAALFVVGAEPGEPVLHFAQFLEQDLMDGALAEVFLPELKPTLIVDQGALREFLALAPLIFELVDIDIGGFVKGHGRFRQTFVIDPVVVFDAGQPLERVRIILELIHKSMGIGL